LILHAAIWTIWKERNDMIFNDSVTDAHEIFDSIMVLSWYWSLNRLKLEFYALWVVLES